MADKHDRNPIVLDYHNTLLRLSDVTLLDQPNWINDNLIGFAFEYFEKEQFSYSADLLGYISPSVTQAIKLSSAEEICIFLDPLNLQQKQHIFMAVNNNMADTYGGTHWSLLVYDCNSKEFHHYDSMSESNHNVAMCLSQKLHSYFPADSKKLLFKEIPCPQQENGYDCGMHVIATCEHLAREFVEACMLTLNDVICSAYIHKKRQTLKDLIYELKTS